MPGSSISRAAPRRLRTVASHVAQLPVAGANASSGAVPFVPLEQAANMSGVRITYVPGIPGIFAECLKNMLDARGVTYTLAVHPWIGEGHNQEYLYKLTAQKSFPTMLYNDERPRNSWVEQVVLADKLGTGPSLVPTDPKQRVLMFGMMNELLAENGLVWNKRLLLGAMPLTLKYGWSEGAQAEAPRKLAATIEFFLTQLKNQRDMGSKYILGSSLTALDIYLATCTYIIAPPGPDILPRTKQNARFIQGFCAVNPPEVQAMLDASPWLLEYRDHILKSHCVVPAVQGGDPL